VCDHARQVSWPPSPQPAKISWKRISHNALAEMNRHQNVYAKAAALSVVISTMCFLVVSCAPKPPSEPSIQFTKVPPADPGGPQKLDFIEGTVQSVPAGDQIVLYAHGGGIWWVQPHAAEPATKILPNGSWRNSTHLGTEYAALLVEPGYKALPQLTSLPERGNGVVALAVVKGAPNPTYVEKKIHFSGYDWVVRSAGSDRGGEPNDYAPENVWVDQKGFLHLRMQDRNGKWTCAELYLTRSLGYGIYRFTVQDSAHLEPSAVLGLFTYDLLHSQNFRNEIDIELSRWGDAASKNAQYVIQPFYVSANVSRFETPAGPVVHSFRWEPGKVSFKSTRGTTAAGAKVGEHVFTSGIPTPAEEAVHINLYDFRHSKHPVQQQSEVVLEKFEYLP
jgi:hypothetical protein